MPEVKKPNPSATEFNRKFNSIPYVSLQTSNWDLSFSVPKA
jgi:hypothetical protein